MIFGVLSNNEHVLTLFSLWLCLWDFKLKWVSCMSWMVSSGWSFIDIFLSLLYMRNIMTNQSPQKISCCWLQTSVMLSNCCLYPQIILTVIPAWFKFSIVCTAAKKPKRKQAQQRSEQQCVKHKEKEVTKWERRRAARLAPVCWTSVAARWPARD